MSAVVRESNGVPLTEEEIAARKERGISLAYRGDINNPRNHGADIPESQSSCLFMNGLPPHVDMKLLLGTLAKEGPFGRVYATSLLPPKPHEGHFTAAAKIQFFRHDAAQRLLDRANSRPLIIGGNKVTVVWNRYKAVDQGGESTRVLVIAGPMEKVNVPFLSQYFREHFIFQTEEVIVRRQNRRYGTRVLEWRFGSFRAQADAAYKVLSNSNLDGIAAWFLKDPVEGD